MRFPTRPSRRTFLGGSAAATAAAWLGTFAGRPARAEDLEPRTHVPIAEELAAIRDANAGKSGRHVVILGAGMAGLCAAFELKKLGHRVTILEGSPRVGGRVWTQRFPEHEGHPPQYHELGAMRIPASHDYTRHYVRSMGLKLRRFVTSHDHGQAYYHIGGRPTRIIQAPDELIPRFDLSPVERAQAQTMAAPAIFGNHLADLIDALTLDDIESLFGLRSPTPRIVELDRITLGEFLEQTVNGSQAAELIGATTGLAVWFENKSLGMFLRDEIMGTGIGLEEIEGGADLLPRALARFFEEKQGDEVIAPGGDADLPPDSILLNTEVSRILKEVADGKVELTLRLRKEPGAEGRRPEAPKSPDFREVTTTCEAVLCTLPFPLLEGSDPGETPEVPEDGKVRHNFGERKRQAIRGLSYASSTKILLHCRRRFWEQDEGIFGGASHSDQATRATYYPSDNAERKDSGRREPGEAGRLALSLEEERPGTDPGAMLPLYHRRLRGAFSGPASRLNLDRPDESAAMRMSTRERGYGPRDSAVSRGPGVLVASYSWGESAREFGKKDRATRRDDAIAIVSGFHHQLAEPGMVLGHESVFWDKHPWSGRAFCFLGPGDHPRHFEAAVAPEGRVYFAGEHCSLVQAWIQGALISALDAVRKIVHDL